MPARRGYKRVRRCGDGAGVVDTTEVREDCSAAHGVPVGRRGRWDTSRSDSSNLLLTTALTCNERDLHRRGCPLMKIHNDSVFAAISPIRIRNRKGWLNEPLRQIGRNVYLAHCQRKLS
jgi:hypothetical protein